MTLFKWNTKRIIQKFNSVRKFNKTFELSSLVRSLSQRSDSRKDSFEVSSSDFSTHRLNEWKSNFLLIYGDSPLAKVLVERLSTNLARRFSSNGTRETLKYFKVLENYLRLTFMKIPIEVDQKVWTKMVPQENGTMIPKILSINGRQLSSLNHQEQQMFLTAIQIYKLIIIDPEYSYETIVKPGPNFEQDSLSREDVQELLNGDPFQSPRALVEHINKFTEGQGLKRFIVRNELVPGPVFSTTKAGVNGPKANSLTGYVDLYNLMRNPAQLYAYEQLLELLFSDTNSKKVKDLMSRINLEINSDDFRAKLLRLSNKMKTGPLQNMLEQKFPLVREAILGRIHVFSEGGGKTRIIAIFDMWSQTVLGPIHDHIMEVLRSFGLSDGTFDHTACAELYGRMTSPSNRTTVGSIEADIKAGKLNGENKGMKPYCFDLTAATDRMPLYLQGRVISNIFDERVVKAWSVMMSRDFIVKNFTSKTINYKVGQPMGALSSWPAMALTHHMIIRWSLKESKDKTYAVIGDDMLIACPHGASRYLEACRTLGMPINLSKSVIPSESSLPAIELAKRVYIEGKQISPIPCEVLVNARKSVNGFLDFYNTISERVDDTIHLHGVECGSNSNLVNKAWVIKNFFKTCTSFNRTRICITMSYPHLEDLGIITKKIEGLEWESWWDLSLSKWKFTTFISEEWNRSINDREFMISGINPKTMKPLSLSTGTKHSVYDHTSIINHLEKDIIAEYKHTMRKYNTHYVDEEGDSEDLNISTEDMYKFIIGSPNPYDLREFIDPNLKKHTSVISGMVDKFWIAESVITPGFRDKTHKLNVSLDEFASWHRPAKKAGLPKS